MNGELMGVADREWSRIDDGEPTSGRKSPSGRDRMRKADGAVSGIRRSSSGRVPLWALEEALGSQLGDYETESRGTKARRPRPRSRRRPSRRLTLRLGTGGVVLLVAGLYLTPTVFDRYVIPAALPYFPNAPVPPRGVEAADQPLGTPPGTTGSTAFMLMESPVAEQEFVAYDPCRPVHFVVRPDDAPAGSEGLVAEAVAQISAATGLQFVDDGHTDEGPSKDRETYQPERYGKKWAPVLITWSNETEVPGLAGNIAGLGGSDFARTPGQPLVFVAGQVMLDAPSLSENLAYSAGRDQVRAVIVHELAHVVGLDHVDDPTQLMAADGGATQLGDGDRAGLALLGAGPCVPQL